MVFVGSEGWCGQRVMLQDVDLRGLGSGSLRSVVGRMEDELGGWAESCFSSGAYDIRFSWAFASLPRYACAIESRGKGKRTSAKV